MLLLHQQNRLTNYSFYPLHRKHWGQTHPSRSLTSRFNLMAENLCRPLLCYLRECLRLSEPQRECFGFADSTQGAMLYRFSTNRLNQFQLTLTFVKGLLLSSSLETFPVIQPDPTEFSHKKSP